MPALSSDQYFSATNGSKPVESDILGMNANGNKKEIPSPFPKAKKKKIAKPVNDDFDDWGFGDDEDENTGKQEKQNVNLLEFENNGSDAQKAVKDGNSSDDLDAFFNEMEDEESDKS